MIIYKSSRVLVAHSQKNDGNMALHTGDDVASVVANRQKFFDTLDIDTSSIVYMNQVHSDKATIVGVQNRGAGLFLHDSAIPQTDALVTKDRGLTLAVMTADCVPVLLWDEDAGIIGVVHAGWKGTARQISSKTVCKMLELGAKAQNIKAFIGSSIGECCYEVGSDTANACGCEGKTRLDLKSINKTQLIAVGLKEEDISKSDVCTSCDNADFFSYRKENGGIGRFMSVISLY